MPGAANRRERDPDHSGLTTGVSGWLAVGDGSVELAGSPSEGHSVLKLALEASLLVADGLRPGPRLLALLGSGAKPALDWDSEGAALLLRVLAEGDVRSWRFLDLSGVLDGALPELAATVRHRQADPYVLDPADPFRWRLVEAVRDVVTSDPMASAEHRRLEHPEWLVFTALTLEMAGRGPSPVEAGRRLVERLALGEAAEREVALLVGESTLLRAAATRPGGLREEAVLPIALHLDHPERAGALYVLSLALGPLAPGERHRLDDLHGLVQAALARTELTGPAARRTLQRRRDEAIRRVAGDSAAADRVAAAPLGFLLVSEPADIARQAGTLDPPPPAGRARVTVDPASGPPPLGSPDPGWLVDVVARDRPGLLATVTAVLAEADLDVSEARLATWPDGVALESFRVHAAGTPSSECLEAALEDALGRPQEAGPVTDASVTFDDEASPWYTLCEVRATDRPGLLHAVAVALATAGVDVHTARVTTIDGEAVDRFHVTRRAGSKLEARSEATVARALAGGSSGRDAAAPGDEHHPSSSADGPWGPVGGHPERSLRAHSAAHEGDPPPEAHLARP